MADWYVVRTQMSAENKAAIHLTNQGFETYSPCYRKIRRHARKTETVRRPLFPGYLFVKVDVKVQRWRSINGTIGVIGLIQLGKDLLPINGSIISDLRKREDETGVVDLSAQGLKAGDKVLVNDGPFAEYTALLEETDDKRRAVLLLDLMGRTVRILAPLENLSAA